MATSKCMSLKPPDSQQEVTFRKLYPTLNEQELKVAEANFTRYLEIALEVTTYQDQLIAPGNVDTSEPERIIIEERSKAN